MIYDYARVSTDGQSVAGQVTALQDIGAVQVWRKTASGAQTKRAQLIAAVTQFDAGDVLLVSRPDRLARSTRDRLKTLAMIGDCQTGLQSRGDAWADTTTAHGPLMLTALSRLSEFERELLHARMSEGRKSAEVAGVKMERTKKMTPREAQQQGAAGESARTIACSYGVDRRTIQRIAT